MVSDTLITYILKSLILPPGINIVLLLLAFILWSRRAALARFCLGLSLLTLGAFSLPIVANQLTGMMQTYPSLQAEEMAALKASETPTAIVILGGGRYSAAPEYGFNDTVGGLTLQRAHYGAYLHNQIDKPILITGGKVFDNAISEAALIGEVLARDYLIAPDWLEEESKNTLENASKSATILRDNGINDVVLVTHAWHMPRAVGVFEANGLNVIPAPTGFVTAPRRDEATLQWFPSADALVTSRRALHEMLGRLWYQLS